MSTAVSFINIKEDFVQGGIFSDGDVQFMNCRFGLFDYNGTQDESPAFLVTAKTINKDGTLSEEEMELVWTVGSLSDFTPSEDGDTLLSEDGVKLKKGSNFFYLLETMINHGFTPTKPTASAFNNVQVHLTRTPIQGRTMKDGAKTDNGVPLVTKFIGVAKKGAAAKVGGKPALVGKSAATAKPAAAGLDEDEILGKATDLIHSVVGDLKGETIELSKFVTKVFAAAARDKVDAASRTVIKTKAGDVEYITPILEEVGYACDGDNVGPAE
jgi:hypothetical protein